MFENILGREKNHSIMPFVLKLYTDVERIEIHSSKGIQRIEEVIGFMEEVEQFPSFKSIASFGAYLPILEFDRDSSRKLVVDLEGNFKGYMEAISEKWGPPNDEKPKFFDPLDLVKWHFPERFNIENLRNGVLNYIRNAPYHQDSINRSIFLECQREYEKNLVA